MFMSELLNRPEIEVLGPVIGEALCDCARAIVEDDNDPDTIITEYAEAKVLIAILKKIDYPVPDGFWGEKTEVDEAYQAMIRQLSA